MRFYSTSNRKHSVNFREAVFNSLPPDNGLYYPESIPRLEDHSLTCLRNRSLESIGFEMMRPFVAGEIADEELDQIIHETINFDIPLKQVADNIHVLELYHGPTWAFKDVGARFLARCMGLFTRETGKEIDILVATSGDTGGAVASGFFQVPGTRVTILYPKGKVSEVQEKQLTTWGENISAYSVEGTFDDCQRMVKKAFLDQELNNTLNLSSANSINVARFLPQSIYYAQIARSLSGKKTVVSVPSGNYGNLTAGLFGWKMGLPIHRFIASSNINKVVPDYLDTSKYDPRESIATYSNAMDVGAPSNFVRMLELFDGSHEAMTKMVSGYYLNDEETLSSMKDCLKQNHYLADPHGIIAYQALRHQLKPDEEGVFLETAHPVKFLPVVDKVLDEPVNFQEMTSELMQKEQQAEELPNDYDAFRSNLLSAGA
jgi:threonine synthase